MDKESLVIKKITEKVNKLGRELTDNADDIFNSIIKSDGYCPCRASKSESNVCVCRIVKNGGKCGCGLIKDKKV